MWCWHKWIVKDKEVLPSLIEQGGFTQTTQFSGGDPSRKPCIVTYACAKCGAEKVIRL